MSSKLKNNSGAEPQATSTQPETREVSVGNPARAEEIRRRAYEIYLDAANNQAVTWTIGSRRNKNSNAACLAVLWRVKKESRDVCV